MVFFLTGDACDGDADGVADALDNCRNVSNANQLDSDLDVSTASATGIAS